MFRGWAGDGLAGVNDSVRAWDYMPKLKENVRYIVKITSARNSSIKSIVFNTHDNRFV